MRLADVDVQRLCRPLTVQGLCHPGPWRSRSDCHSEATPNGQERVGMISAGPAPGGDGRRAQSGCQLLTLARGAQGGGPMRRFVAGCIAAVAALAGAGALVAGASTYTASPPVAISG